MIAWGDYYHFRTIVENDTFQIYQVDRVARGCLSYVFISQGQTFIIDPLRHIEKYESFLQKKGAALKLILDTHAHADHISGGPTLAKETGAPYYLHPYDGIHPFDILPPKIDYEMLQDGATFSVGEFEIKAIHTPGHTLGQVNFLITAPDGQQYFASGDTLFLESFGRPDLGGQGEGWAPIVYETIHTLIRHNVPDSAYLIPGHYAQASEMQDNGLFMTRMSDLWQNNSALQFTEREAFIDYVLGHLPTLPPQYVEIKRVNAGIVEADEEKASELELGKNICALSEAYE
jgi:glyoxylase-like metal-dependent hydrolase (beta-lactamase superfamily II)